MSKLALALITRSGLGDLAIEPLTQMVLTGIFLGLFQRQIRPEAQLSEKATRTKPQSPRTLHGLSTVYGVGYEEVLVTH